MCCGGWAWYILVCTRQIAAVLQLLSSLKGHNFTLLYPTRSYMEHYTSAHFATAQPLGPHCVYIENLVLQVCVCCVCVCLCVCVLQVLWECVSLCVCCKCSGCVCVRVSQTSCLLALLVENSLLRRTQYTCRSS